MKVEDRELKKGLNDAIDKSVLKKEKKKRQDP